MTKLDVNSNGISTALLIGRLITGGALILAAFFKLRGEPLAFLLSIESFKLLPDVPPMLAYYMPWFELIVGGALVLGVWSRQAALLAGSTLLAFTFALYTVIYRDMKVDCGCFGGLFGESTVSYWSVVRNLLLAAPAIPILLLGGGRFALTRDEEKSELGTVNEKLEAIAEKASV